MSARSSSDIHYWAGLTLWVLTLKACFIGLDSVPRMFMGDSASYVVTATTGWIPPDRSFTYGFFLKAASFRGDGLVPLIIIQSMASAGAALLAGLSVRLAGAEGRVAPALAATLIALEPLHLAYERYVMTESLAGLSLAILVVTGLGYLRRPQPLFLVIFAAAGLVLISFRTNYVPFVWALTLMLPLTAWGRLRSGVAGSMRPRRDLRTFPAMIHAAVLLAATLSLHGAYRHVYGAIRNGEPAYVHTDGLFALAVWAPLIKAEHFPDPDFGHRVLAETTIPLQATEREAHRWTPGGLALTLSGLTGSEAEANRIAKRAAMRAGLSDPLGVLRLGFDNLVLYTHRGMITASTLWDQGANPITEEFDTELTTNFGVYRALVESDSLTRWWHGLAVDWYRALILVPVLALVAIIMAPREKRPEAVFLALVALGLIACGPFLGTMPVVRYLHPVAWIAIVLGVITVSAAFRRLATTSLATDRAPAVHGIRGGPAGAQPD